MVFGVTGGEDRGQMDIELQKEISVIWQNLSQKSLDLLAPIHKGERSEWEKYFLYIFLKI